MELLNASSCDLPVTVIVTHVDLALTALTVFHAANACLGRNNESDDSNRLKQIGLKD